MDLDIDVLKEIVHRRVHDIIPDMATHQRLVHDEPYLIEVQKKYPFLGNTYNIYATPPEYETPIHDNPGRGCAVDVPIFYTEDSWVIFYDTPEDVEKEYIEERIYNVIISDDVTEAFRFNLDRPTLINTKIPHRIIGGPREYRVVLSWSIPNEYRFDDVKKLLGG
jgi:hypothetical protein